MYEVASWIALRSATRAKRADLSVRWLKTLRESASRACIKDLRDAVVEKSVRLERIWERPLLVREAAPSTMGSASLMRTLRQRTASSSSLTPVERNSPMNSTPPWRQALSATAVSNAGTLATVVQPRFPTLVWKRVVPSPTPDTRDCDTPVGDGE